MKKIFVFFFTIYFHLVSPLQLTSPAFKHNGLIPEQYTCEGSNISPRLEWTGAPAHTKSFVLIVEDPDATGKTWVHWLLYNIPGTSNFLPENAQNGQFTNGATVFNGAHQWGGPCPPAGTHRYYFILYALDIPLDLRPGKEKQHILHSMHNHIIDKSTLIGLYGKKTKK